MIMSLQTYDCHAGSACLIGLMSPRKKAKSALCMILRSAVPSALLNQKGVLSPDTMCIRLDEGLMSRIVLALGDMLSFST